MNTYFYNDGEREVRVEADSYQQISTSGNFGGGQCPVDYRLTYTVDQYNSSGGYVNTLLNRLFSSFIRGPIVAIYLRADKRQLLVEQSNGLIRSQGLPTSTNYMDNLRDITLTRRDGLPDNCGSLSGGCETEFFRNGAIFFTLDSCPPIREGDDCASCCAELLPIARTIRV
ncbi:MAG: hypothetical protein HLUCCA11_13945 [Phormidesmis priestleyi Ana]|uniref:Uncharacterized protein n=1 Tax=Phormidesmis priestleyi Ana TaxID=1666911 RepID=A0A0P7ZIY3_9CYAN|nr:MAG: hypothetical protein HLUCCA11_13945 [Phormidesmis priestleyi Ana]